MLSLLLEKLKLKKHKKTLALIRFDGIGDYLHMRPFFPYLRQCKKYKDYRFILIGRDNFISLSQTYDRQYFDHIFFIKYPPQIRNRVNRLLRKIRWFKIDELISPVRFLDPEMVVDLFGKIKAKKKIAADCISSIAEQKQCYENQADIIIETDQKAIFEFDRYKSFFEKLIEEPIPLTAPSLEKSNVCFDKKNYAVLSPFANEESRSFSIEDAAHIILHLLDHSPAEQVILLDNKRKKIEQLFQHLQQRTNINPCYQEEQISLQINGKKICWHRLKTFQETLPFIQNALFLFTVDTSFLHAGAMSGTPTVYAAGGRSYGVFHPYPKSFTHVSGIYPSDLSEESSIQDIALKDIIAKLDNFLNNVIQN